MIRDLWFPLVRETGGGHIFHPLYSWVRMTYPAPADSDFISKDIPRVCESWNIHIFKHSNTQTLKHSNTPTLKGSNIQRFKDSNIHRFKYSIVQILKSWTPHSIHNIHNIHNSHNIQKIHNIHIMTNVKIIHRNVEKKRREMKWRWKREYFVKIDDLRTLRRNMSNEGKVSKFESEIRSNEEMKEWRNEELKKWWIEEMMNWRNDELKKWGIEEMENWTIVKSEIGNRESGIGN
jgi:hypothetical protein